MIRIKKSIHRHPVLKAKKKSAAAEDVLEKLNSFLDATEPEPVYFLTRMWNDQQQAVTYKELREAIQSGHLDEKTLQAWQNDYANFVNEKLKPVWTEAMTAANADLMAKHPDYFFDPMSQEVLKWTNEHGAQWVSSISDEQKEAITAMLDNSFSGDFTVDELARAIRPTVGLNKTQSKANVNYYKHIKESLLENNPGMKETTAEKRARDAAQKYAAKQHRQRAFTIATTEMAFAYNKGADEGMKQAQAQNLIGKVKKVWSTAADEGVCSICGGLDGTEIDMEEDFDFKGHTLYSGQKQTPPAHPRCRCAVLYIETEPPKYQPEPEPDVIQTWSQQDQVPVPEPPEPELPKIPEAQKMPKGMKYNGKPNLGQTGEIHSYLDELGDEWLFKPAQTKSGNPEAFRAYVQEAGYKVQGIVDPETAVPVGTGELGGKFGAFQKRVMTVDDTVDLKHWQYTSDQLPPGAASQLQREHVTDWLMGNFDSHGGNFVMDDAGKLIGLDKEQSFRYINQIGGQQMSYTYHPNSTYGETEPIYNTLFRRFAKGEIDLDLQDTLTFVKRVEAIPDTQYREIFRGYAEELRGKGKAAEELLDEIVDKKGRLREDYRQFYSDLLTERTGKKQAFIWADEAAQHMQQPLTAVTHSPDVLKKMNTAELKQLAKQKQIPYYNNMNKTQLVTSISDPIKAPDMSAQVRDRLAANEAARKAAEKAPVPRKVKEILPADEIFADMSKLPDSRLGVPIKSDKGNVEGLNLTGRRMQLLDDASGSTYEVYEVSGKLTKNTWSKTWDKMKPIGDNSGELFFEAADDAKKLYTSKVDLGASIRTMTVTDGETSFELYIDGQTRQYNGWRGFFRMRTPVTSNGAVDATNMKNILKKLELDDLITSPDGEAEMILKKTRLVWQNAPNRIQELDGLTPEQIPTKLDMIIKQEKIDLKRVNNMKMVKVFDGYQTYIEEGIQATYEKAGLKYVWTGIPDADDIVKVIQSPGLLSNNNRFKAGMKRVGASPVEDFRTGGSDNVFTRIGVKNKNNPRFDDSYRGSRYRILIDPKEMQRTDWYAFDSDSFGNSDASRLASRPSPVEFIKNMATSYRSGNEIMFRHGIAKESFIGISCQSNSLKAELLDKFKKANITAVNGIPIEDFVKVGSTI
jgi:hypothetical protein